MRKMRAVFVLAGALGASFSSAADPILTNDEYNTAMKYASKYFLSYREEYGADIRMAEMLKACDFLKLSEQQLRDLPDIKDYVINRFKLETENSSRNVSKVDMALLVMLATQHLLGGYRYGYAEAIKGEFNNSQKCAAIPKVYEMHLQTRQKQKK